MANYLLSKIDPPTREITCDELKEKASQSNTKLLAYIGDSNHEKYGIYVKLIEGVEGSDDIEFYSINDYAHDCV